MNALKSNQHQKGIVLLSCLVLLILILSLLRFMMSTSHIGERRAGIESEMFNAREYALSALRDVERAIVCPENPTSGKCDSNDEDTRGKAKEFWAKWLVSGSGTVPSGFYKGTDSRRPADCKLIWKCTDWTKAGTQANVKSTYTPSRVTPSGRTKPNYEYVVEVFSGSELGLDEKNGTDSDISNLIFRVTAVGYGQVISGDQTQETNHMMQADYALSGEGN